MSSDKRQTSSDERKSTDSTCPAQPAETDTRRRDPSNNLFLVRLRPTGTSTERFQLNQCIGDDGSLDDATMEALVSRVVGMATMTPPEHIGSGQYDVRLRHVIGKDRDWWPDIDSAEDLRLVIRQCCLQRKEFAEISAKVIEKGTAAADSAVAAAAAVVSPDGSRAAVGATAKRKARDAGGAGSFPFVPTKKARRIRDATKETAENAGEKRKRSQR